MNKTMTWTIIIIFILGLGTYLYFKDKSKNGKEISLDDYYLSTQSQSNEMLQKMNLDKPSEDASYILDTTKLDFPQSKKKDEKVDYNADPEIEWILNLEQINGEHFKKKDLEKLFDKTWKSNFRSTVFGFSPVENRWTYVFAGGVPEIYSKIQVAVKIQEVFNEENPNYDPKKLERYVVELQKRIKDYPSKLTVRQTEPIEKAVIKAKMIVELYNEFNEEAIILLKSDSKFAGLNSWDALQSVGLKWGDGDLFHWSNYHSDYGHDQHFSVWTTTEPGYFLPEEIQQGQMNPNDLVFGFSIPRCADPKNVFDIMINSAKYCQKRLGGTLLGKDGQPFDETREKKHLIDLLDKMKVKGIIAGSDNALQTF